MSTISTPVDEVPVMATLCAADRCDRCGAQAYIRVRMPSGLTLDFCGHDYRPQKVGLAEKGAVVVVDDLHQLTVKPAL